MLNLHTFLQLCDPDQKVVITNENGIGGAAYLAWPEHEWTVKEALDELGCGGFHVVEVSVESGMLYIRADECPWCFESYWERDEEWNGSAVDDYEVVYQVRVNVREKDEDTAREAAWDKMTCGDAEEVMEGVGGSWKFRDGWCF